MIVTEKRYEPANTRLNLNPGPPLFSSGITKFINPPPSATATRIKIISVISAIWKL